MHTFHKSVYSMGTRFNLLLPGMNTEEGDKLSAAVHRELNRLENIMSCFIPSSEVSYINLNAPTGKVSISDELFQILMLCKDYNESTLGLFDAGMGKQIEYWKENTGNVGSEQCPYRSGIADIELNLADSSVAFRRKDVKINLGGFGKGYALDKVLGLLKNAKVSSAYLSFGESSVACLGSHPFGDHWSVGVEDHINKGNVLYTVPLENEALSTSGISDQNPHILNPGSGLPHGSPCIVVVKSTSATEAEVWSTALASAKEDQFQVLKESLNGLEVLKATHYEGKWNFWGNKT